MRSKIISALFCLLLAAGLLSGLILPDRAESDREKRALAQIDSVKLSELAEGKTGEALENYLADQFPLRDAWVTLRTGVLRAAGLREISHVYFGKDGYLMNAFTEYNEKRFHTNLSALAALHSLAKDEGIPMRVMLVPTSTQIESVKKPAFAADIDQKKLAEEAEALGLETVDVFPILTEHAEEYIYYRTDHHWTSLGAYYAYRAFREAHGEEAPGLSAYTCEELTSAFRGTTYAKVNAPGAAYDTITAYYTREHRVSYNGGETVSDSLYEKKYLETSDEYAVFVNSNQAEAVIYGEGEGRLLILKDSYANTFAQFTADDYEECRLIDLRFYGGDLGEYIRENGISEILVLYNIPNFAEDTALMKLNTLR